MSQTGMLMATQALAFGIMGLGLFLLLYLYLFTGLKRHLLLIPAPPLVFGSCLFLSDAYAARDVQQIPLFFLLQSLGLISVTYWARLSLKSRREIASTGEFDPGMEPEERGSRETTLFWFLGQAIEDIAKPIVSIRGEFPLNQMVRDLSARYPILSHFKFTRKGEFKLRHPTDFLEISPKLAVEPLSRLFEQLVREFARTGRIQDREELAGMIQDRCRDTVSKYMDLLVDEGLLYTLAGGVLTNRVPTGIKKIDRLFEGGVVEGQSILVVARPSTHREALVSSFLLEGLTRGEDCLVVSSVRPASQIQDEVGRDLPGRLLVVDCYSGLSDELPAIDDRGEVIVSPVAIEVVDVAIARMTQRFRSRGKRAVVDILTTYLLSNELADLYPFLLSITSTLKKNRCTSMFVLNPSALPEEGQLDLIQETFDTVIILDEKEPSLARIAKLGFLSKHAFDHTREVIHIMP